METFKQVFCFLKKEELKFMPNFIIFFFQFVNFPQQKTNPQTSKKHYGEVVVMIS